MVAGLPAAKPKPGFPVLAKQGASPRTNLPPEFKDHQANRFVIAYPASWAVGQPKAGSSRTWFRRVDSDAVLNQIVTNVQFPN